MLLAQNRRVYTKMPPALSIIMPAYNAGPHIKAAICSLLNQDFQDWELVVLDDGSTDSTAKVVLALQDKSPNGDKIRYIKKEHRGCVVATDEAIREARAQVCTVVDADDLSMPGALREIAHCMYEHPDVGFMWTKFVCGHSPSVPGRAGWGKTTPNNMSLLKAFAKTGWWGGQHQRAFRREIYLDSPGLDYDILYAVDLQLAAVMAETQCNTIFLDGVAYWYRRHNSQITGQHRVEQRKDHTRIISRLRARFGSEPQLAPSHTIVPWGCAKRVKHKFVAPSHK